MAAFKRAFWGLVIGIVVLAVMVTAVSHFSAKIINSEVFKEKIQAGFLEYFNTQIDYQKIDISFFPHPHLVIHLGVMSMAQQVESKFMTAAIYPKLFPLLTGKFAFSKVSVDAPETKITLTEESAVQGKSPIEAIIDTWKELNPIMSYVAKSENDDIHFRIRDARVDLYKRDRLLLSLWDLDGKLSVPDQQLNYSFSCRSNLWQHLLNKGFIDRRKMLVSGEVRVKALQLKPLQQQYFPGTDLTFGDSQIDLNLDYETDGHKQFKTRIVSRFSTLPLMRGKDRVVLEGKQIEAGFSIDDKKIEAAVSSLDLVSPRIHLAGTFSANMTKPGVRLELSGKNADVASVRKVFLFIVEDDQNVNDTFRIIRSGRVPEFTIMSQAPQMVDLDMLRNVRVQGHMVDGEIFVPGIDFDLKKVNGEVDISKGILTGTHLSARFKNTTGSEGRLILDLSDRNGPFLLDIMLDADASQLPSVLSRLIDDKPFQKELKRIRNVKGRALGRLVLGDTLTSIRPLIDVSTFNVSADYQRVPFPLVVKGEKLTIEDTLMVVSKLTASTKGGDIFIREGNVDWGKASAFYAKVGRSKINLDVVYPWLRSMKVLRKRLAPVPTLKGEIRCSDAQFAGNYLQPESIRFRLNGRVEGLVARATPMGDKIYLDRGGFSINRKGILFSEMKLRHMDASLNVSGRIDGYIDKASIELAGVFGSKALQQTSHLIRLPSEITLRAPLWISSAHLSMGRRKPVSFSGKLAVQKGPSLDIDISNGEAGFAINHLRIKDNISDATIKLKVKQNVCDLSFKGRLEKSTLDAFLTENKVVTGYVEGDIQTWIRLDNFLRTTAIGKLKGEGFMVFLPTTSLKVNHLILEALSNHLYINTAQVLWIDEQIDVSGRIEVLSESLGIDLDVSMDHFDWNKYGNLITGRKTRDPGAKKLEKNDLPMEGIIRFHARHFRYSKYTWRPFKADFTFRPDYFMIDVHQADLCGISMPGMAAIHPKTLELTIGTVAKDESLDDTLFCLGKQTYVIEGLFDLKGYTSVKGDKPSRLLPELKGEWTFSARDGHINRLTVLTRIFELLNVAEIFKLKLPDLRTEGFSYKKIKIHWRLDGGSVFIDKGHLDSTAMEIAFTGKLDLINDQVDVLVLVAPLQTLNLIVKNIPVVRKILAGTFISIPFRVEGDLQNPDVSAMNPKDVGSEMWNLMKRTVSVPIEMIQPLTNGSKKEAQAAQ